MQRWDDIYFKKRIVYALKRQRFEFDTAELLFSTHAIDLGTQFLLRRMIDHVGSPGSILDLGCGYGVIGIVLAKFFPAAQVILADKDLLAIHYAAHNATLNQTHNVTTVASIGVDQLPQQPFDLVASNIPGHIGDRAIERDFVINPLDRLSPAGSYWMVVVTPLGPVIQSIADKHELNLEEVARRPGHVLYRLRKQ